MAFITTTKNWMVFTDKQRILWLDILAIWMGTKKVPKECVCKVKYDTDLITLGHNGLVDVSADLLGRVCKDVSPSG